MSGSATVKIRCGHCRRVLHEVTDENYLRVPRSGRRWFERLAAPRCSVMPEFDHARQAARAAGIALASPALHRLRYVCHRRCGKTYQIGLERYRRAVLAAFGDGRGEVLLGLDC